MKRLHDKVTIITGAAQGQGAAEVRQFVADGAKVVAADINDDGRAICDELGASARFCRLDVRSADNWAEVIEFAESEFGPVNVLVNNAGIVRRAGLRETDEELLRLLFDVNAVGTFLGMRAVVPSMERSGGGSIVNISSISGLRGSARLFGYSASKYAVRGMTKCAALELAPLNIRVNLVLPGLIDTPMTRDWYGGEFTELPPIGFPGRPDDVARLVVYLASDESAYTTGAEHLIDGGLLAG